MSEIQWDFVCFCETRTQDRDAITVGGHRLITILGDEPHAGVAILVHFKWKDRILNVGFLGGRLIWVDISIGKLTYRVISVYVPDAGYPVEEFQACLDNVTNVIGTAQRAHYKCILCGGL